LLGREFGLIPEGVERDAILEGCVSFARKGLEGVQESSLLGVGVNVVRGMVHAQLEKLLGGSYVREGFLFAERWLRANRGHFEECVGVVGDLNMMSL
jgi:hypothetical protein